MLYEITYNRGEWFPKEISNWSDYEVINDIPQAEVISVLEDSTVHIFFALGIFN